MPSRLFITFLPRRKHLLISWLQYKDNSKYWNYNIVQCLSHVQLFVTLRTAAPTPRACSNSCPSSRWCHPAISTSSLPLLLLPSVFPSIRVFSNESVLCIRWPKYRPKSASASVLPMNIQDWFPLGLLLWSPCSPRDSQESSPTPQFKSTGFLVLSFLYSPTLTSIHDYW